MQHRRPLVLPAPPETFEVRLTFGEGGEQADRQRDVVDCREQFVEAAIAIEVAAGDEQEQFARCCDGDRLRPAGFAPGDAGRTLVATQGDDQRQAGQCRQPREQFLDAERIGLPRRFGVVDDQHGRGAAQFAERGGLVVAAKWQAERRGDGAGEIEARLQAVAADEETAGTVACGNAFVVRRGQREIGLADSRRAEHRHRFRLWREQRRDEGSDLLVAAEAARSRRQYGQCLRPARRRRCRRRILCPQAPQVGRQVDEVTTVVEDEEPLFRRVLALQGGLLAAPRQAEAAVLGAGENSARPLQQSAEIRIMQAIAAADEEDRAQRCDRAQHGLRVCIAQNLLVRADAEDHRLRPLPVPVQVDHRPLVAAQDAFDAGAVHPGDRRQPADLFDQAVVVGRRDRDAESEERVDQFALSGDHAQGADALAQPARVLATIRCAELARQLLGAGQQVVEVAGVDVPAGALGPPRRQPREVVGAMLYAMPQQAIPRGTRRIAGAGHRDTGADDQQAVAAGDLLLQVRPQSFRHVAAAPPPSSSVRRSPRAALPLRRCPAAHPARRAVAGGARASARRGGSSGGSRARRRWR
ncbi:MAG: hypothetical protein AW07_02475 [Candidatus Accumulibacter sp. SK-11]|nr:MAG: hypothetical protein AW07_02475 [Candidatus Accumulibacter sp. SK-11]